ncbi:hypothetical protein ACFL6C_03280 [Myxococcota bacterium]
MRGRFAKIIGWCAVHPVWAAVMAGAVLRLVAALVGSGWFAVDDYLYVIEPAARWLEHPTAVYPSRYRSPLFPRLFSFFMAMGQLIGAEDPRSVLKVAYLAVGCWSLLAIPGAYLLARPRLGSTAGAVAAWLVAAQAIMPRISSRALIEVVCVVPLVWSLVLVDRAARSGKVGERLVWALAGGMIFGLAVMLRFQVGIIAAGIVGWLICVALRADGPPVLRYAPVGGFVLAGMGMVLVQGGLDLFFDRPFFDTMLRYVSFNLGHSSKFGTSAWYNYVLQLIGYTVPPATVALAGPLWRAARAHPLVAVSLVVFVLAHSLVPHKEDRFLFPILPLLFVVLGAALAAIREGGRWQRGALWLFWIVNGLVLVPATLSDGHRNLTVPLSEIHNMPGSYDVAVVGMKHAPAYYLGNGSRMHVMKELDTFCERVQRGMLSPDFVLLRPVPDSNVLARVGATGLSCEGPREYRGDLVDRLLVVLNPRHNKRRAATGLLDCRPRP